jgi:ATP-binding cassette subfamily B protein/subfamily B ATP-binding cassette protein MsbA
LGTAGILWLGAIRAIDGLMSVGGILLFLSYLASLYGPLESLMYAPSSVQFASGSAKRVLEILETAHDVRERVGAISLSRARGAVTIDNVNFGYEADRPVLRGLSLDIPAGQTLAIVGGTGAGKSTLASLVPRLFDPWSGRLLLDGQDLRDLTLSSLRQQVSLVLQEPFLFPVSVAQNIAYGKSGATAQQIEDAAKAAGAHEFISRLPDGYQTVIGERGATLSGGERQRLSIARALLRDAPVLILDEPTSALDAATEAQILQALRNLMAGRTTLMIAHRLSTVRDADRIVVLEHGQLAEEGTHEQLLEKHGVYARFYHAIHSRSARPAAEGTP